VIAQLRRRTNDDAAGRGGWPSGPQHRPKGRGPILLSPPEWARPENTGRAAANGHALEQCDQHTEGQADWRRQRGANASSDEPWAFNSPTFRHRESAAEGTATSFEHWGRHTPWSSILPLSANMEHTAGWSATGLEPLGVAFVSRTFDSSMLRQLKEASESDLPFLRSPVGAGPQSAGPAPLTQPRQKVAGLARYGTASRASDGSRLESGRAS